MDFLFANVKKLYADELYSSVITTVSVFLKIALNIAMVPVKFTFVLSKQHISSLYKNSSDKKIKVFYNRKQKCKPTNCGICVLVYFSIL